MEVRAVEAVESSPQRPLQALGVTAELAMTRTALREAASPERWDAVQGEVHRLQYEQGMSPLAALQAVYAKLASGWTPWVPPAPR